MSNNVEDYTSGVWDVRVRANLSDSSLKEACKTDAPTCVMVIEIQGGLDGPREELHRNGGCRLCSIIERYALGELGVSDIKSYTKR